MDILTYIANSGQHNILWTKYAKAERANNLELGLSSNLSDQQILRIWSKVETEVPYSYQLPNSINPNDYIK